MNGTARGGTDMAAGRSGEELLLIGRSQGGVDSSGPMRDGVKLLLTLVRGGISLCAGVLVWAGLWLILDRRALVGDLLWRELVEVVLGTALMIATKTFFSNGGLDAVDREGSLRQLGRLVKEGGIRPMDKVHFYASTLLAIVGSILFWHGMFTIVDCKIWQSSLWYNALCLLVGGTGVLCITLAEDSVTPDASADKSPFFLAGFEDQGFAFGGGTYSATDAETDASRSSRNSSSTPNLTAATPFSALSALRVAISAHFPQHFRDLSLCQRGKLYMVAMVGNIAAVVFWKGFECLIENYTPDTMYTGFVFLILGTFLLHKLGRLGANSGLDDDGGKWAGGSDANGVYASGDDDDVIDRERAPSLTLDPVFDWVCARVPALPQLTKRGKQGIKPGSGGDAPSEEGEGWAQKGGSSARQLITLAAVAGLELFGVTLVWTGIEWYFWDGDYIPASLSRDVLYVVVSLAVLVLSGTFTNTAGVISPVAAYQQMHEAHLSRGEERQGLLSTPRKEPLETELDTLSSLKPH